MIEASSRWRVSLGSNASIYNNMWIPCPGSFKVISPRVRDDIVKVSQLQAASGDWNVPLIYNMFVLADSIAIFSIPPSYTQLEDTLSCHHLLPVMESLASQKIQVDTTYHVCLRDHETIVYALWGCKKLKGVRSVHGFSLLCWNDGSFKAISPRVRDDIVKVSQLQAASGDWNAPLIYECMSMQVSEVPCSLNLGVMKAWWNSLYCMKIPLKIRIFIWRACHHLLPVMESLAGRKIQVYTTCPMCLRDPKTIVHALWGCKKFKGVRSVFGFSSLCWNDDATLDVDRNLIGVGVVVAEAVAMRCGINFVADTRIMPAAMEIDALSVVNLIKSREH
ncbi:hypothetical protein EZV62_024448 [Acer yangbiense]|uniref:Reverse transcriptase zinc-binding domain-containing protein n=1 Tax=Acer yangbiense TaxID=1000413 RepID=A0A5C7GV56_9ROSI|nr:hypothetical protein EZV62_024448 [Acer yangbiense]